MSTHYILSYPGLNELLHSRLPGLREQTMRACQHFAFALVRSICMIHGPNQGKALQLAADARDFYATDFCENYIVKAAQFAVDNGLTVTRLNNLNRLLLYVRKRLGDAVLSKHKYRQVSRLVFEYVDDTEEDTEDDLDEDYENPEDSQ